MNAPYLESSEQLHCLFPDSLHKIKFHIFQNIYKFLIQVLRPFKYNNTCELCADILDKDNRGRIMVKKCFFLNEKVIDIFHEFFTSPKYKSCHFILLMSGLLVQWNVGRLEIIVSTIMYQIYI